MIIWAVVLGVAIMSMMVVVWIQWPLSATIRPHHQRTINSFYSFIIASIAIFSHLDHHLGLITLTPPPAPSTAVQLQHAAGPP